jgi:hypothetical protein
MLVRACSGTPTASGTSAALRGKVSPKPARVTEATPPHVVATERPVKIAVAIVLTNEAKTVRCLLQSFFWWSNNTCTHSLIS